MLPGVSGPFPLWGACRHSGAVSKVLQATHPSLLRRSVTKSVANVRRDSVTNLKQIHCHIEYEFVSKWGTPNKGWCPFGCQFKQPSKGYPKKQKTNHPQGDLSIRKPVWLVLGRLTRKQQFCGPLKRDTSVWSQNETIPSYHLPSTSILWFGLVV